MKKFLTLSFAAAAAALASLSADAQVKMKYSPDPVFDQNRISALHNGAPSKLAAAPKKPRKILIFSRTSGFRHYGGIVAAKEVFKHMGEKLGGWETVVSDDINEFTPENLKKYDAVILNNPTAACFGPSNMEIDKMPKEEAKAAIEKSKQYCKNLVEYVKNGGGVLGLHSAPDSYNYDNIRCWEYTDMLGGDFVGHPWNYGGWIGVECPKYMFRIDDENSPITKGIWPSNGFMMKDEVYMMGKSFDRSKCRVLVSLDVDQSYFLLERQRLNPPKIRDDKDIGIVWIKKEGGGRVAYSALGHDWNNYPDPRFQEMLMRLVQFACGDLEADTSSIPQNKKSAVGAICEAPTLEQIGALSALDYGQGDKEINEVIFGVYSNNFDKKYCAQVEKFIYDQLSKKSGTEFYRSMLAELLWASGISNRASCNKFERLMKSADSEGIRGRLSNAVDHFKKREVPYARERKFKVPEELAQGFREQCRLMKYLADNPSVPIPGYLTFDALGDAGKARLVYTIAQRGGDLSQALEIEPASAEMAVASAFAAAKAGSSKNIPNILKGAKYLKGGNINNAASYIVSIKSPDVAKVLLEEISKADAAQTALISACLAKMNLDSMVRELFEGYESKSPELRASTMKTAASIANAEVFSTVAKIIASENDKKTKAEALKALMRAAQSSFELEMFAHVESAFAKADAATKKMLLRLVRFASDDRAVELCRKAYLGGLKTEAVKALGEFESALAFEPLVQIAKASSDEREKTIAQIAILDVADRCGFDDPTAEYIIRNAVRNEDRDRAADIMVRKPTPRGVELLREIDRAADADKAQKALSKIKTAYLSSEGEGNFRGALDKDVKTRWSNNTHIRKGHWIAFDFGYPKKIGEIDFNLGSSQNDFPDSFKVMAGPSLSTVRTVDCAVSKRGGILKIGFEKPISAQVVKIVATEDKSSNWWSIHELEFKDKYAAPDTSGDPDYIYNGASIDFNSALDGDSGTRWTNKSFIRKGMWFGIDFRKPRKISKIFFDLGSSQNDFPTSFKVMAGASMKAAAPVAFKSSRNGSVLEVALDAPVSARAFKIVSEADSQKWWSIHELKFAE